jgi:hypothetical protein
MKINHPNAHNKTLTPSIPFIPHLHIEAILSRDQTTPYILGNNSLQQSNIEKKWISKNDVELPSIQIVCMPKHALIQLTR